MRLGGCALVSLALLVAMAVLGREAPHGQTPSQGAVVASIVSGIVILVGLPLAYATVRRSPSDDRVPAGPVLVSPDGLHWWDGHRWLETAASRPTDSVVSPDGSRWWSGQEWVPPTALNEASGPVAEVPSLEPLPSEPAWWSRMGGDDS